MRTQMSTSCYIGVIENGKYKHIYCHWDGDPIGVGSLLVSDYSNTIKIRELLELGDISCLASRVPTSASKAIFDNLRKQEDGLEKIDQYCSDNSLTLSYKMWRGDNSSPKLTNFGSLVAEVEDQMVSYVYIHNNNHWSYMSRSEVKDYVGLLSQGCYPGAHNLGCPAFAFER